MTDDFGKLATSVSKNIFLRSFFSIVLFCWKRDQKENLLYTLNRTNYKESGETGCEPKESVHARRSL